MPAPPDEVIMGAAEAAKVLGVDRTTVLRWARSGRLTFLRKMAGRRGDFLFDGNLIRRTAAELVVERANAKRRNAS